MMVFKSFITLACVCVALGAAPAVMASGGGSSGGGGGGGGARGGGLNDPAGIPCATLSGVSAPVGYFSTYAAIWHDYTVRSCSTGPETITVRAVDTDATTGVEAYNLFLAYTLTPGQSVSGALDNDFAPFTTAYAVRIEVGDNNGGVLAAQSTTATTPPPR
jgi:hypothetical protein